MVLAGKKSIKKLQQHHFSSIGLHSRQILIFDGCYVQRDESMEPPSRSSSFSMSEAAASAGGGGSTAPHHGNSRGLSLDLRAGLSQASDQASLPGALSHAVNLVCSHASVRFWLL